MSHIAGMANPFVDHPRMLGMSWWSHGLGAIRIGGRMVGAGLACMVHAIVPALFTETAGRTVKSLGREMERRKAAAADWPDFEI